MGMYNPHAPLMVGNEFAPVIDAPYTPELFVERGYSFRIDPGAVFGQASMFVAELPPWSVPGHAYLITLYRRGQETSTGPMQTVTVPLAVAASTNTATGGGAATATDALTNPTDGWYARLRSTDTGEAYVRCRSDTIPALLAAPAITQGKRIVDVSILYTASAEPGNEDPVPLQINHYYDVTSQRVSYGTAQVDLRQSLTGSIRRSRWGEIDTWTKGFGADAFTEDIGRSPWNYELLTLFETGSDYLVEFRTESAAQEGPREVYLHYAAMQITYCEENRVGSWGIVLGSDYDLTGDTGAAGGYRLGRNTQGPDEGVDIMYANGVNVSPGGGSFGFGSSSPGVADLTMTIKRADYGPYNNQGPPPRLRGLRTVDQFPGHPGITIINPLEPGQIPTAEPSDLLPQIIAHVPSPDPFAVGNTEPAFGAVHVYGRHQALPVSRSQSAVQAVVPAADAADTAYPRLRFWARSQGALAALRLVVETADQGPVTVAQLSPAELVDYPEIADGWRRVDLAVDPALVVDDVSIATGTQPEVTGVIHEASGTTGAWSVTAPAGDLEGQVLLLLHCADSGGIADMGTPTGGAAWTLLHEAENFDGAGNGVARLWWKVGGGAEPASYGLTQASGADGAAIVLAVAGVDADALASAAIVDTSSSINVDTPAVPMPPPGGLDVRLAATLVNVSPGATYTAPGGWTLLAGLAGTPFVAIGAAAQNTTDTGGNQNMVLSDSPTVDGRIGVTVTLPGPVIEPAAPRWVSDTTDIRPWEVLGARVIDPTVEGAFNPAAPAETGVGTYGGAHAEGGTEGALPDTADVDVSVVWGQALPTMTGLAAAASVQPLAVVDPECPVPNPWALDGIDYIAVSWEPIDSGYGFVGLGHYELQRQDDTMAAGEWETVATPAHPLVDSFDDYEARVGVATRYRIRYVHLDGMAADWSTTATATIAAPGVTGAAPSTTTLIFTSNADPAGNLAYTQEWEGSAPVEAFDFPEAGTLQLQRMYGRDFQAAFRPTERGGAAFTRTILVGTASVPVETLSAGFTALRDLAWSRLPYVCVRSTAGDRWFANVNVPSGTVRNRRSLYVASVTVTEVSAVPFAPSPSVCEGMTARGTLPSTIYAHRFATTPAGPHLSSSDLRVRVLMRLDQSGQVFPLVARFNQFGSIGWILGWERDGTATFFNRRFTGGAGIASFASDAVPYGPGDAFWLELDYTADTGTGISAATFATSVDGTTWTPLATTTLSDDPIPATHANSTDLPLTIGASYDGTADISPDNLLGGSGGWNGVIGQVEVAGDAGAILADPVFADHDGDIVEFTDDAGNAWTVPGGICTVDRRACDE